MKSYTTLQIWEAAGRLTDKLRTDEEPEMKIALELIDIIECVVRDLIQELSPHAPGACGDITPAETILVPAIGFVPVAGTVNADPKLGNRVEWNREGGE